MASAVCGGSSEEKGKRQGRGAWRPFGWPRRMPAVLPGSVARWILLVTVLLASLASSAEPPSRSRAAGGRGPELRSRVTQALEELERAVAADPADGQRWWNLGIQAQVAAGGSVSEEVAAVALLERALLLAPWLGASYENAMALGDMHRGVRNASRARHFYAAAAQAAPMAPTQYVYAGLTYELEGEFASAARSFRLAGRMQALHNLPKCVQLGASARFAGACWPSLRGASYLAYLSAALLKACGTCDDPHPEAMHAYAFALGRPPPRSLAADCATQRLANAASGALVRLQPRAPAPPAGPAMRAHDATAGVAEATTRAHDAAAVQAELRRRQFPAAGGCGGRKLLYAYSQAFGFGAHAHMLSLALNIAVATNRVLVPVDEAKWWLVREAECGRAGFSCFFEAFTNCSVTAAERGAAVPLLQLGAGAFAASGGPDSILFDWDGQTAAIKLGFLRDFVGMPAHGAAWWRGQLLRFVMQPRAWLQRELERAKQAMRWQEPVVGLHVRHGDKLKEANRLSAQVHPQSSTPDALTPKLYALRPDLNSYAARAGLPASRTANG